MVKKILKFLIPYTLRMKMMGILFKLRYAGQKRKKSDYKVYPTGLNLIGHIRGDFGLGESCRLVAEAIKTSEIPFVIKNVYKKKGASETNESYKDFEAEDLKYNVNLIHLNPDALPAFVKETTAETFNNRYQIGYWLWELPEFPKEWLFAFDMFDEIWTPADFVSDAVRSSTNLPVYTVPYAMKPPVTDEKCDRSFFGLPEDKFLYLVSYDGFSNSDRKNPEASLAAYREAFPEEAADTGVIIKATHASDEEISHITTLMHGYSNVYILTDSYSKAEFNSLIKCADAHISLHRSEGFGLVMAEAMFLGTPTVSTNWSANAEFMCEDACCMVPVKIIEIEKETPPYHKGNHWADPDVHVAAGFIRRLHDDKEFYEYKKNAAAKYIRERMSPERAAGILKERMDELAKVLS